MIINNWKFTEICIPIKGEYIFTWNLILFDRASIGELAKGGPQKVLVRDMTEDMIPRHIEYEHTAKVSPPPSPNSHPIVCEHTAKVKIPLLSHKISNTWAQEGHVHKCYTVVIMH